MSVAPVVLKAAVSIAPAPVDASVSAAPALVEAFVWIALGLVLAVACQSSSSCALAALSKRHQVVPCHSVVDWVLGSAVADQWGLGPLRLEVTSIAARLVFVQVHH